MNINEGSWNLPVIFAQSCLLQSPIYPKTSLVLFTCSKPRTFWIELNFNCHQSNAFFVMYTAAKYNWKAWSNYLQNIIVLFTHLNSVFIVLLFLFDSSKHNWRVLVSSKSVRRFSSSRPSWYSSSACCIRTSILLQMFFINFYAISLQRGKN